MAKKTFLDCGGIKQPPIPSKKEMEKMIKNSKKEKGNGDYVRNLTPKEIDKIKKANEAQKKEE